VNTLDDTLRRIVREELASALATLRTEVAHAVPEWVPVRVCGLAPTTRRKLTRAGKLDVARVGRVLMVRSADVAAFIASQVVRATYEADPVLARAFAKGTR
jgi:hypothetical protein